MAQHVANDIGYNEPFVFSYIASGALSTCLPIYFFSSLLGLVPKPPLREKKGQFYYYGGP